MGDAWDDARKIIDGLDLKQAQQSWNDDWKDQHAEWQEPHMAQGSYVLLENGDILGLFVQFQKPEHGKAGRIFAVNQTTGKALTVIKQSEEPQLVDGVLTFPDAGFDTHDPHQLLNGNHVANHILTQAADYAKEDQTYGKNYVPKEEEKPSQVDALQARDAASRDAGRAR